MSCRAVGDAPTVLCSPTVVDETVVVGSAAPAVHAFDAATGEPVREHGTGSYVETAPAVADGRVYTADADGTVYAPVRADGGIEWTHATGQNLHSRAVAVYEDLLVVGTAGTMPAVGTGETDATIAGVVVALDRATRAMGWSYSGPAHRFTGPAVGDGRVSVGNQDRTVAALDPSSDRQLWTWTAAPGDDGARESSRRRPPVSGRCTSAVATG